MTSSAALLACAAARRYLRVIGSLPKDLLGLELKGRRLGRYELLHRITRGGMSEVLLGQQLGHAGFKKLVVLKRVAENSEFGSDSAQQMLIREARLTAGFVHSNIAQVYDLELIDGGHFLSMEFVPGVTLSELLRRARDKAEKLPFGLVLAVTRDLAEALHYAHTYTEASGRKRSVIHRDVAPKNVMIRWDGVTKLLDFGLAKPIDGPSSTMAGLVKGTVSYMSPEQIRGMPLDGRTDVFSLGLVMFELLAGAPMMTAPGDTPPALRNGLPSLASRGVTAPEWVEPLLSKMLAQRPDHRMANAREASREITRAGIDVIWEQDAVSNYLDYLFAVERAQMQRLLADLSPEDVGAPQPGFELTPPAQPKGPPPLPPEPHTFTGPLEAESPSGEQAQASTRLRPMLQGAKPLKPLMDEPSGEVTDTNRAPLTLASGEFQSISQLGEEPKTELKTVGMPQLTAGPPSKLRIGWWLAAAALLAGGTLLGLLARQ